MLELSLITWMSLLSFWRSLIVFFFKISGWQYCIVLVTLELIVPSWRSLASFLRSCLYARKVGDFNDCLDNPSLKPYTNEFMSLLDINNMSNYVQVPTHISGHILDLVLTPVGVDHVNRVEVSPTDYRISDHAFITFELDMIRPATYSKKITFRSYRGLNVREATIIIEDDLLSAVTEGQTSVQHVDSYNRGFTSLRDQFCSLVTKEIESGMMQNGMITEWCPCTGSGEGQRGDGEGLNLMPLVLYL